MNFDFNGERRGAPKGVNHKRHQGTRRESFAVFSPQDGTESRLERRPQPRIVLRSINICGHLRIVYGHVRNPLLVHVFNFTSVSRAWRSKEGFNHLSADDDGVTVFILKVRNHRPGFSVSFFKGVQQFSKSGCVRRSGRVTVAIAHCLSSTATAKADVAR